MRLDVQTRKRAIGISLTSTIVSKNAFTQVSQSDLDSPVDAATAAIRSGFRLVIPASALEAGDFFADFFAAACKVDTCLRAPLGPWATNAVAWERREMLRTLNSLMAGTIYGLLAARCTSGRLIAESEALVPGPWPDL